MKRSISFRSRLAISDGTYIDVLCIFFGNAVIDMGLATELIQDALKVKEPIPDCVALLSLGQNATALVQTWQGNPDRAKVLMNRGRTKVMRYLKELSIWQFAGGKFSMLFTDPDSTRPHDFDMSELVRSGLGQLVEQHDAYQVAPSGHVFKHPSGKRSKRFFLASQLVKDEIDAYFVALCICLASWDQLLKTRRLYIDTMGIYPIARAMEEMCVQPGEDTSARRWEIVSFHSHTGLETVHVTASAQAVILISASTSGSMAIKLADKGIPGHAIITILDAKDQDRVGVVVHAHDAYLKLRYGQVRPVDVPNDAEAAIELTGEYFAATGKEPRALTLAIDHTPKGLKHLLSAFSKRGYCCLQSSRLPSSSKVDAVSLDEKAIVADKNFKKWVKEELRLKTPMSVSHIVALDGVAALSLAKFCARELKQYRNSKIEVVKRDNIGSLTGGVTGVLVCAPLVGNGHALRVVSRDLREIVPKASRHFLMGVGLPETEESWARLNQFLAQSGNPSRPYAVSEWQHLPLGISSGSDDAWGRANRLMQRTEQIKPHADFFQSIHVTQDSLKLAGDTLQAAQQTFLNSSSDEPMKLTDGFVYWAATGKELEVADSIAVSYLAMTAALQTAREFDVAVKRLKSSLHETVVLDPENFLRFNDSALQASLLRAAYSSELDYSATPELSLVMREFLEKVFLNHEKPYGAAALEFAFALACDHLRLTKEDTVKLIESSVPGATTPSALIGLMYFAWDRCRSH